MPSITAFSFCQRAVSAFSSSRRLAISPSSDASRSRDALIALLLQRLALDLKLHDLPLDPIQRRRLAVDLHLQPRRRLVNQVDGLVR